MIAVVEVDTTMMMMLMRIIVKPSEFLSSQVFNDCVTTIITGPNIIEVGAILLPRRSIVGGMIVGAAGKELMTAVWKWLTWQERGALAFDGGST